jgi:hypothetical protein
MRKNLLLILLLHLIVNYLQAQDFPYGKFTPEEINMTRYDKDTTAHAVVLKEFGKTWISTAPHTPLVFEYHTKIKILDEQAFDQGNITIPIYKIDESRYEEVSDIKAITCYKDENGNMHTVELSADKIFHVKQNRYWDAVRFAIPGLHKGCIIEYKYHLESPLVQNFRKWMFQAYIPKMYSEYETHVPAVYNYNVSLRGPYQLTKTLSKLEKDCFTPSGTSLRCDCSQITYIMSDIPAFVPETDMTSPKNFMSAIYFELKDYYNMLTDSRVKVAQEWTDIDGVLKNLEGFGGQLKKNAWLKDRLKTITDDKTDDLSKAKAVYNYIQKTFRFNGLNGFVSNDGIKKSLENGIGGIGDINLTLIAALNTIGIHTEAVLLSTRENGVVNKLYPVLNDFNYVVAKANIGDQAYLLDASDLFLPFGLLPLKCINDQGRVISMDKPSYWINLTASQKKTRAFTIDLTLQDDGKVKGSMTINSFGYEAYDKRKEIKKFNSLGAYIQNLDSHLNGIKVVRGNTVNMDNLDQPFIERYEIELNSSINISADQMRFNPFFIDAVPENPFKLQDRTYPVDRGAEFDDRFKLTLHIPKQFAVKSLPQNISLKMPLDDGRFLTDYKINDDGFSVTHVTQFTKAVYLPVEYPDLKEIFNKIIQAQNAEIILKRS